jgi:rhamnose transport system ATP-binding protein
MASISKHFPGIKALDRVDFEVRTGEVHALIGENGAGKSTLVKLMTGVHTPTEGEMFYREEPVDFRSPQDSQNIGIAAIHQEAIMFPELSIAENVFLGHPIRKGKLGFLDWPEMHRRTQELMENLELTLDPKRTILSLSTAERHMVEILKALSHNAEIVIMDEPTSALSLREVDELFEIIRRLRDDGKAIVFISHKFDEIRAISDTFTVLRDGRFIGSGSLEEHGDDEIVRMMVGRSLDQLFPKSEAPIGAPLLQVNGLSSLGTFRDVSFTLHAGEILGFFGLIGAGRSEVMRGIFGIDPTTSGTVTIGDAEIAHPTPKEMMARGVALVPEDRQTEGAILDMTIQHNATLPSLAQIAPQGILRPAEEERLTDDYCRRMEVRATSWDQLVGQLSGGNQQKVVLAKWLATEPRILIVDEPTKGIDVATKAAVHQFMSDLAEQEIGVLLVSSELPEILGMSDRIIVMHEGLVTGEFSRDEANSENIMSAATGGITVGG